MSNSPHIITPSWNAPSNIVAYTSTRNHGVSEGEYAGCNVGDHVGDDPTAVKRNRATLPYADRICWLQQVHGNHIVGLPIDANRVSDQEDNLNSTKIPTADAAMSSSSHSFCAVMTADCVPILLCDSSGTQVAAIHAGWKGLRLDIITKCVKQFNAVPNQLMAWIGPAICQTCYEVDLQLANTFSHYAGAIKAGTKVNKFLLDLPKIAEFQLLSLGIDNVINSRRCTYCESESFYSHRRATHQGLTSTGRIVSVIGLR